MKTFRTAVPILVACLALAGCGGQDGGGTTPAPSQTGGSPVTTPPTQGPVDPTAPAPSSVADPTAVPPTKPPPRTPASPPPAGGTTLTGTVTSGVEPNCLLLDGYLLVGGPRDVVKVGAKVTVTGKTEPGLLTTCQQGTPFRVDTARPA